MESALYGPGGFYEREGGGAGRRGDFLTGPEVGPLFGAVVARALDAWFVDLGRPDGFTVYDAGAGAGTLGRSLALAGSPHRYVAVDRSAVQRARHEGLESAAELPDGPLVGVVVANELLDNLPFDLTLDGEPFDPTEDWPEMGLAPQQDRARSWVEDVLGRLHGRLVVLDYCSTTASMAARPWTEWLRTYRGHDRGGHPMDHLGQQDITVEVAVDQLRTPDEDTAQADVAAPVGDRRPGRGGAPRLARTGPPRRPRGHPGPQPHQRGRGPARPGRHGVLPGPRVDCGRIALWKGLPRRASPAVAT